MNHFTFYRKKLVTVIVSAFLVFSIAVPCSGADRGVIIIDKTGNKYEIAFPQLNKISVGQKVSVENKSGETVDYDYSEIDRIMIGAETSGIKEAIKDARLAVWPTIFDNEINVSGSEASQQIVIYNLEGKVVLTAHGSESVTTIDTSRLSSGYYVLQTGSQSVKIMKK